MGMTDIGTGTYTIFAQIAAETLGVPLEQVTVKLGDSGFPVPPAPVVSSAATARRPASTRRA